MKNRTTVRVSYLLTTRNRAEFLQKTLDNVREFITHEDELIIVDAASTDGTRLVAESNTDIVSLFISEPDRGEAHGINKGILASTGRFIKFLSDDDYFFPNAMHDSIQALEENVDWDAIICGGEAYVPGTEGNGWELLKRSSLPRGLTMKDNFFSGFKFVFCGLGLLVRRRTVELVGLFDTRFISVDLEYIARLTFSNVDFRYVDINLFRHYRHSHSHSLSFAKAQEETDMLLLTYSMHRRPVDRLGVDFICKVLGMRVDTYGRWLAKLVLVGASLHGSWVHWLVWSAVVVGTVCMKCYRRSASAVRSILPFKHGKSQGL